VIERVLVTGASRGIGRAVALRLAEPGRELLLHGRDQRALEQVAGQVASRGASALTIAEELANPEGVARLVLACGTSRLSALVNNAGFAVVKPVEAIGIEEWERNLAVSVTAPFLLVRGLLPRLERGSSIVNVLSVAAHRGFSGWTAYCAAKSALDGFGRALREELRPRGIRVIGVYPAATDTALWDPVAGTWDRTRMIPPSEVADAIAFALERPPEVGVDTIEIGDVSGAM